jgi:cell division topological specificity factor
MSIFDYFFNKKPTTASVAKERLQIVLAHERANRDGPDFLPRLQKELLAVIARYVEVKDDSIKVNRKEGGTSVLEINVELDVAALKPNAAATMEAKPA